MVVGNQVLNHPHRKTLSHTPGEPLSSSRPPLGSITYEIGASDDAAAAASRPTQHAGEDVIVAVRTNATCHHFITGGSSHWPGTLTCPLRSGSSRSTNDHSCHFFLVSITPLVSINVSDCFFFFFLFFS